MPVRKATTWQANKSNSDPEVFDRHKTTDVALAGSLVLLFSDHLREFEAYFQKLNSLETMLELQRFSLRR